jgi:hypothetical protein
MECLTLASAEQAETAENGFNAELAKHAEPRPLRFCGLYVEFSLCDLSLLSAD